MVLVRFFIFLILCLTAQAKQLPIYIEDNHLGSFGFFAQELDLDEEYTLILFDAHSDASNIAHSDSIRERIRKVRSSQHRAEVIQELRQSGKLQAYNWIEPLMPRPIQRVIWIAGSELSEAKMRELEEEAIKHLDWRLQIVPRSCGALAPHFEVWDFRKLVQKTFDEKLAVSIDLDFYAQDSESEAAFEKHWAWVLGQAKLEALSFAISRPWLDSELQAERLMFRALEKASNIQNCQIVIEPFQESNLDRSERAKELIRQGQPIPRFTSRNYSKRIQRLLVQNRNKVTVGHQKERWENLLQQWQSEHASLPLTVDDAHRCIDGVYRMPIDTVGDIRINNIDQQIQKVEWWQHIPDAESYDLLPHIPLGKNFTRGPQSSYLSYSKKFLCDTLDPALAARTWKQFLPWPSQAGIIKIQAHVHTNEGVTESECIEIRVRCADGFRGSLSEQAGSPYAFGIGLLEHNGERGGECLIGNDCANFLVYGFRQSGVPLHWSNPRQLRQQLQMIHSGCTSQDSIPITENVIESGLVLDFGSHVGALWHDKGMLGFLDHEDEVIHHLGGAPEISTLGKLLEKYRRYNVLTLPDDDTAITMHFGGDVNLDEALGNIFSQRFVDLMKNDDLTVVNLECALSKAPAIEYNRSFSFVAEPNNIQHLANNGVELVTLGNNHIYDAGSIGLRDTIASLEKTGFKVAGLGSSPLITHTQGVSIGWISFNAVRTLALPSDNNILQYPRDREIIEEQIREISRSCDFVIALPHWGNEYTTVISEPQRKIAKEMVHLGANMVIGSHPHIVQATEYYRGRLIAYSLGNLYFPNKGPKGFNDYHLLQLQLHPKQKRITYHWIQDE
ncbi:CapA family protein [Rubritalea marina]|uniref:CapA family protein n=1 Tax=Rubritalea marina TaxID=361055 RepID=UPI00037D6BC5|nr:CapA family protein [Rubritalea marina]